MKLWRYGQAVEYLGRRYRLDGMLGSGGMADVCLAWDEREQREVALKILKSDDLDQETLNRFMKEASQIADWQHPHILRVYESLQVELIDAASGSVLFYMVSEYARGGDLQKRLIPGRSFPLSAGFALFRQLCDAVQYAHEHGVIHRDLKPLNMLFRRPESGPEEVVLSDFGLAVQVNASHYTFAHGGTLAYMAPEQFQGNALPASDIFALGVILYLLCTGSLPFRRTLQDMPRIIQGQALAPTRPSLLNPELPPALDDVILRAVRELAAERYRQPRDFWEAIEQVLTVSAQTFPFVDAFWQNAGRTWPYDGVEQPRRSRQVGQLRQSPNEETPEVEEGSVSALWIAREKQKASPVRLPLPTNSILMTPNLVEDEAPEQIPSERGASSPSQVADEYTRVVRDPAAHGYAGHVPRAGEPPQLYSNTPLAFPPTSDNLSNVTRPTASASGSKILPSPHSAIRDGEQTNRRRPPFGSPDFPVDESERQTSRKRASSQLPGPIDRQGNRRQTPGLFTADLAGQSSRRRVAERDSHGIPTSSAYGGYGASEDDEYPDSRTRASAIPNRRSSIAGTSPMQARNSVAAGPAAAPQTRGISRHLRLSSTPQPRPRRRVSLLAIVCGLVLLGLVLAIFAATNYQGVLLTFFGAPVTRVTLQARTSLVQDTAVLNLRTDGGQLDPNGIPGRQLTATSSTQSATANATGSTQGKRATGQLTFINNGSTAITLQSTIITDSRGISISFDGPITVPALNPSFIIATGFAVNPGINGNIAQFDIVKNCCATNIVVKNNTAFTGGQDAQVDSVIQQKDIDGAAKVLEASGQAQALAGLSPQVKGNERVSGTAQCHPQINPDQKAGAIAKRVAVQVTVMCNETVYDYNAARQSLTRDLQQMENANSPSDGSYALAGQVSIVLIGSSPASGGGTALEFHAQGLWVYQFKSGVLHTLASLIAGKSQEEARALLLHQPGVAGVQFSTNAALPVNTSEIQFSVQPPPSTPLP